MPLLSRLRNLVRKKKPNTRAPRKNATPNRPAAPPSRVRNKALVERLTKLRGQIEQLTHHQFMAERNKFFDKFPTKRDLTKHAWRWGGTANSIELQRAKRSAMDVKNPYQFWKQHPNMRRFDAGLRMYLDTVALRAPAMPPKVRNFETGSEFPTLYRGFSIPDSKMIEGARIWRDEGYMAFSRDRNVSLKYGFENAFHHSHNAVVLFRMNVRDVPPGTPWIWYTGTPESFGKPNASFVQTTLVNNNEVMLPPGILQIKNLVDDGLYTSDYWTKHKKGWKHGQFTKRLFTADVEYRPFSDRVPNLVRKAANKFKRGIQR